MKANESLSTKQRRFIAALLEAPTLAEAAEQAGISPTTAWRYLRRPTVRGELSRRSDALLAQASAGLLSDMALARATLRAILSDPAAPPSVQVSAARAVLDHAVRLFELYDLCERVSELERRISQWGVNEQIS